MIITFGSSFLQADYQNNLLVDALKESGKEYLFVNSFNKQDLEAIELQEDGNGIRLFVKGVHVVPTVIYVSRLFRSDCFVDIPEGYRYPTILRQKVASFLTDIRFAFEDVKWLPGPFETLERGESKIALFRNARNHGLIVPSQTKNSFEEYFDSLGYRKVLGFPFSISFDSDAKQEVAATLLNSREAAERGIGLEGLPWQWQTAIQPIAQVRCVVIGDTVHSYRADIAQFDGKSLREVQEDGVDVMWTSYVLPEETRLSLISLMQDMRLNISCPEFLITENNHHVFIDLNPCGDWAGFLSSTEDKIVASEIVTML